METNFVKVTNRDSGTVGYSIPDMGNLHRTFMPGETKNISLDELKALQYVPGGEYTLKHLLVIGDKNALSILNMENVPPEYFYGEREVRKLLSPEGSLDQLLDTLDYAPDGVKEMIKKIAVDTKLPDTRKREAIERATGFSISNAIQVNTIMEVNDIPATEEKVASKRRSAPITAEDTAPKRRTTAYEVVE